MDMNHWKQKNKTEVLGYNQANWDFVLKDHWG